MNNEKAKNNLGQFIPSREACELTGIKYQTLRKYAEQDKVKTYKKPSGQRMYHKPCLENLIGCGAFDEKEKIIYCRVSSRNQLEDLERQCIALQSQFPDHRIIKDCGSGINFKRKGLETILELSMSGKLKEVVVAHKDRLCRFGFDLIEFVCSRNNTKLIVLDREEHKSSEQELAEDVMAVITVFACKQMGKRRYRKDKDEQNKALSHSSSEENTL